MGCGASTDAQGRTLSDEPELLGKAKFLTCPAYNDITNTAATVPPGSPPERWFLMVYAPQTHHGLVFVARRYSDGKLLVKDLLDPDVSRIKEEQKVTLSFNIFFKAISTEINKAGKTGAKCTFTPDGQSLEVEMKVSLSAGATTAAGRKPDLFTVKLEPLSAGSGANANQHGGGPAANQPAAAVSPAVKADGPTLFRYLVEPLCTFYSRKRTDAWNTDKPDPYKEKVYGELEANSIVKSAYASQAGVTMAAKLEQLPSLRQDQLAMRQKRDALVAKVQVMRAMLAERQSASCSLLSAPKELTVIPDSLASVVQQSQRVPVMAMFHDVRLQYFGVSAAQTVSDSATSAMNGAVGSYPFFSRVSAPGAANGAAATAAVPGDIPAPVLQYLEATVPASAAATQMLRNADAYYQYFKLLLSANSNNSPNANKDAAGKTTPQAFCYPEFVTLCANNGAPSPLFCIATYLASTMKLLDAHTTPISSGDRVKRGRLFLWRLCSLRGDADSKTESSTPSPVSAGVGNLCSSEFAALRLIAFYFLVTASLAKSTPPSPTSTIATELSEDARWTLLVSGLCANVASVGMSAGFFNKHTDLTLGTVYRNGSGAPLRLAVAAALQVANSNGVAADAIPTGASSPAAAAGENKPPVQVGGDASGGGAAACPTRCFLTPTCVGMLCDVMAALDPSRFAALVERFASRSAEVAHYFRHSTSDARLLLGTLLRAAELLFVSLGPTGGESSTHRWWRAFLHTVERDAQFRAAVFGIKPPKHQEAPAPAAAAGGPSISPATTPLVPPSKQNSSSMFRPAATEQILAGGADVLPTTLEAMRTEACAPLFSALGKAFPHGLAALAQAVSLSSSGSCGLR